MPNRPLERPPRREHSARRDAAGGQVAKGLPAPTPAPVPAPAPARATRAYRAYGSRSHPRVAHRATALAATSAPTASEVPELCPIRSRASVAVTRSTPSPRALRNVRSSGTDSPRAAYRSKAAESRVVRAPDVARSRIAGAGNPYACAATRNPASTAADQASRGDLGLPLFGQSGGHRRVDVRTAALGHQCGGVAHGRRTRAGEARNHGWHDAAHAGRQLTYGNGAVTDHRDTPHRVQRSLVAVRWHDESARQSDRVLGEEGDDVTGCLEVDR